MNNKVERELVCLYEKLNEKYDLKSMNISGSIYEFNSILPDDIQTALKFWFDVRIRKVSNNRSKVTSRMIKDAIFEDLEISLPHKMIGGIMISIIGEDNVFDGGQTIDNPYDQVFLFENVELVELSEYSTMKIFIAQPMSGVPDEEVEKIREHVTKLMLDKYGSNIEIIDQFHVPEEEMPDEPLERPGIHLLGRSIQFLADADLVVFVSDFLHAKGCCVELAVCKEYDIPFEVCNISDIDKLLAETDKRDNSND